MKDRIEKLVGAKLNINIDKDVIVLYRINDNYPEDSIELIKNDSDYSIIESHRDKNYELYKTDNQCEAIIISALMYKKMCDELGDILTRNKIKEIAKSHNIEEMHSFLYTVLEKELFTIGELEYDKVSLKENGDKGTVYFHNMPLSLVENAKIERCYLVLYNFAMKYKEYKKFYDCLSEEEKQTVDFDKLAEMYVYV